MKKVRFLVIFLVVCLAGYVLGRATVTTDVPVLTNVHKDIPLFPKPPKADPKPEAPPKPDKTVIIETPEEGTRPQGAAFEVSGRAQVGVPTVHVVVTDIQGVALYDAVSALSAGQGEPFGRFVSVVSLPETPTAPVTVTVTRDAAASEVATRIVLFGAQDEVSVKTFFQNAGMDDTEGKSCDLVFSEQRTVSGKTAIYRAALEALLQGPNADEVAAGYSTSIPGGVTLKSVAADSDGVVTADFDDRLTRGVAGSCRVGAIRAQIGATLKQFPEVRDVIITVNGKSEDVLQP